ncbi:MAG TPA: VOC family protein [Thermomicrobiales bacterium]|nr:VOC family protein [Thermomicrobiales bacterium]
MKPQPLITVSSVPISAKFYCDLLGAQQGHGGEHYEQILDGTELVMQLHGFDADVNHAALGEPSLALGNGVVLWFETDDFDSLLSRIREHGITLDREPFENAFARQMECWLHDPDGYQVVVAGPSAYTRQALESE